MRAALKLILPVTLALLAAGCGKGGGDAPAAADPADAAAVASLPPPFNTADVVHGKALFAQCRSCHTIAKDGANMTGPNLHGLFGRKIASHEGYDYSAALRAQSFVWEPHHLDSWLAAPRTFIPGAKMTFLGFPDAKDRIDVIGYLKTQSDK